MIRLINASNNKEEQKAVAKQEETGLHRPVSMGVKDEGEATQISKGSMAAHVPSERVIPAGFYRSQALDLSVTNPELTEAQWVQSVMDYHAQTSWFNRSAAATYLPNTDISYGRFMDVLMTSTTPTIGFHQWESGGVGVQGPAHPFRSGVRKIWDDVKSVARRAVDDVKHPMQGLHDIGVGIEHTAQGIILLGALATDPTPTTWTMFMHSIQPAMDRFLSEPLNQQLEDVVHYGGDFVLTSAVTAGVGSGVSALSRLSIFGEGALGSVFRWVDLVGGSEFGGLSFKEGQDLIHFEKHLAEFKKALQLDNYTVSDYVKDANLVIQSGTYVPELNGYVRIVGGKGEAKVVFAGLDKRTNEITTFHLKPISYLEKKAPSLGWFAQVSSERTDLIGQYPELGWIPPYGSFNP